MCLFISVCHVIIIIFISWKNKNVKFLNSLEPQMQFYLNVPLYHCIL